MGKKNQSIITCRNWKIVINAAEDMKVVSKCLWRVANCGYIADIKSIVPAFFAYISFSIKFAKYKSITKSNFFY